MPCCACFSRGLSPNDPNSYSNPEAICVDRLEISWTIDFNSKMVSGNISYKLTRKKKSCNTVIFDVKELNIKNITKDGTELDYSFTDGSDDFGKGLKIKIPEFDADQKACIRIEYDCPGSSSLIWLTPAQTHGKTHPYMFSQGQAINNRSLLPCQDTPGLKATYSANVTVEPDFLVLMSAIADPEGPVKNSTTGQITFKFEQMFPIPSYLIAIAIGKLGSKQIGPRSTLYAEPGIVDIAAEEFSETEAFIQAAEKFAGPYVWKIYDILVLPPSFPLGGMENPNLTFATPTLLAGDKSLTNIIIHEIAHSWTGNMVTNRNYEHFWLNEGWTKYLERKILGDLNGEEVRQFHSLHGLQDLKDCLKTSGMSKTLTKLVPDLRGTNPDDSFSIVPYEKGFTLIYYLEELVGVTDMDAYMMEYIDFFKFKSIDTDDFKKHFIQYFKAKGMASKISGVKWNKWFYSPGLPPFIPHYDETLAKASKDLYTRWMAWDPNKTECPFKKSDFNSFSLPTTQIHEMLGLILEDSRPFDLAKAVAMDKVYNLSAYKNCEIRCYWSRICIKASWLERLDPILKFISEQGRMKYLEPIYTELYAWPEARQRAIHAFKKNGPNMMSVPIHKIAKILQISPHHFGDLQGGYATE